MGCVPEHIGGLCPNVSEKNVPPSLSLRPCYWSSPSSVPHTCFLSMLPIVRQRKEATNEYPPPPPTHTAVPPPAPRPPPHSVHLSRCFSPVVCFVGGRWQSEVAARQAEADRLSSQIGHLEARSAGDGGAALRGEYQVLEKSVGRLRRERENLQQDLEISNMNPKQVP